MNHHYLPGRCIRALFAALLCVAAVCMSAAENRFIYLMGYNSHWDAPTTENADRYETSKMYETSPGSNVYEGVFGLEQQNLYFRFMTQLAEPGSPVWRTNVISPKYTGGYPLEPYGNSGAWVARNAVFDALLPNNVEPGAWVLPSPGTYKFIVDMNRELLVVVPVNHFVTLVNTDTAPTHLTLGDCAFNTVQYAPAGPLNLRFYDFASGKWINPNEGKDKVTKTGSFQNFTRTTLEDTMGLPFSVDNWIGGTVASEVMMPKTVRIKVTPDNGPHTPEDVIYMVNNGATMLPTINASEAVMSTFLKLLPAGDGTYSATTTLTGTKMLAVNFVKELAADPADNIVISPVTSGEMWAVDDGLSYASARKVRAAEASYFNIPYRMASELTEGTEVKITVNPGNSPYVTFEYPSMKNGVFDIYLVGTPNGWSITDDSCPLHPTDNGGYYGHFTVDPEGLSFRFFTKLGAWTSDYSIGSAEPDFYEEPIMFEGGGYSGPCVKNGLGNWAPQNFTGTDLYCYVNIVTRRVIFSEYPIPEAGNILPTGLLGRKEGVFAYSASMDEEQFDYIPRYEAFDKLESGAYRGEASIPYNGHGIYLFTRMPESMPSDLAWGDSYHISPVEGAVYMLDDLGVAEGSFVKTDAANGEKGRPFVIVDKDGNPVKGTSFNVEVDFAANKIYFENVDRCPYYLVGAISDGEWPTYATRSKFRRYTIPYRGGIVDIPAGKMDFRFVRSIAAGEQYLGEEAKVTFENGFAYINTDIYTGGDQYGWINKHVVCPEWDGGKVFVSGSRMLKMDGVDRVTAAVNSDGDLMSTYSLTRRSAGSLVFSGKVKFHKLENPFVRQILDFCLYPGNGDYNKQINFASPAFSDGMGTFVNQSAQTILPQGTEYDSPVLFSGFNFYLPALKFPDGAGEVEMDVTVDLDAMTLHATVAEENVATVYEVVENGDAGIDGIYATPSPVQEDVVTLEATVGDTDCSFNLTSPGGAVIQPDGGVDVDVTFDENGSYTGRFAKTPAGARSAARRAAAKSAKWNISLPESGTRQIFMAVDEAAGTVRIVAPDYNKGYFIHTRADWDYLVYPGVENFEEMKKSMLRETSDGVLEGDFINPSAESVVLEFALGPWSGTGTKFGIGMANYDGGSTFTLAAPSWTDTKTQVMGRNPYTNTFADMWYVNSIPGKVHVVFDSNAYTMTLSHESAGINSVEADGTSLRVIPVSGGVRIEASKDSHIDIYSMQGLLVRSVDVTAGSTVVELPAGLYIVNRAKILVR